MSPLYKHVAPLGLCWVSLSLNPTYGLSLRFRPIFTYRPSGALVYFVIPPVYKHIAPLGLKASFSRFPFLSPSPLPPFRFNTCRPSGALVYLFVPPVYKHIAPLGLNPSRFPALNPENPLILKILIQTNGTCRPAINMSPLWG